MEEQMSIFEIGLDKYEGTSEVTLKKERKKAGLGRVEQTKAAQMNGTHLERR